MIDAPTDPVQDLINNASFWGKKLALSIMNEDVIILPRDMSNQPNEIVALGIVYETLESEPEPNSLRWAATQLSRSIERTRRQLLPWLLKQQIDALKRRVADQRLAV